MQQYHEPAKLCSLMPGLLSTIEETRKEAMRTTEVEAVLLSLTHYKATGSIPITKAG